LRVPELGGPQCIVATAYANGISAIRCFHLIYFLVSVVMQDGVLNMERLNFFISCDVPCSCVVIPFHLLYLSCFFLIPRFLRTSATVQCRLGFRDQIRNPGISTQ